MSDIALKVAVRVRPLSRREMEQNQQKIVKVLDTETLIFDPEVDEDEFFFQGQKQTYRDVTKRIKKKLTFEFDTVFNENCGNQEVFEKCMSPLVNSVLDGYNCSVFVYGATSSGKTYTMLGSNNNPGLTYLAMQELFFRMDELKESQRFDIGISYLEVYNELVMNLLTKSGPLKLREDTNGIVVGGLTLQQIHSAQEVIDLLQIGNKNRTQHATDANAESSRSHAIFQVHIRIIDLKTNVKRTVKLSMIDLAGSERAAQSKCRGMRFKEGANINKSLLALGNCINKLAEGSKSSHVPYRDSNLTRILKDSLGGNCRTLMIANVSPSSMTYEDTHNTLKYASRAKKIRTTCKQNVMTTNMPKELLLKKYTCQEMEIRKLNAELQKYKERTKQLESQIIDQNCELNNENLPTTQQQLLLSTEELSRWYTKIDATYEEFKINRERCYMLKSNQILSNVKANFKEQHGQISKILSLDGGSLNADNVHDNIIKKDKSQNNEQIMKAAKMFQDSLKALEDLKYDIEATKMNETLNIYINAKESYINMEKLQLKADHSEKMSNIYKYESENFRVAALEAFHLLQKNYLLLRSVGEIDNAMLEKLRKLQRFSQGQRSVKFHDNELNFNSHMEALENLEPQASLSESFSNEKSLDLDTCVSLLISNKRPNDTDEHKSIIKAKKRKDVTPPTDCTFAIPKGRVPETPSKNELNATYCMAEIFFSERTNNLETLPKSTKAMKGAKSGISSKFILDRSKENKKFSPSNRVKKSLKIPNRTAASKTPVLTGRPKLFKSAVASSLVTTSTDKIRKLKK